MKQYTKVVGTDNINTICTPKNKGAQVTPTRKLEMEAITLLESILPFTLMGRKVTENWLWYSYNKSKMKINKESTGIKYLEHDKKVTEVFNILGTSNTKVSIDDLPQDDEFTPRDAESAANKLTENDVLTKNNGDLLLDEGSIDDTEHKDNKIYEIGIEVVVYIDPAEALKSVSNLKKHNVNRLCVINLKEKGLTILGENIEKERRWAHTMRQRERN